MARPTGLEPVTYGLAYPLRLSPPAESISPTVCGLDYIFTISGGARIVSTDPACASQRGFLGIAIAVMR